MAKNDICSSEETASLAGKLMKSKDPKVRILAAAVLVNRKGKRH